MSDLAIDWELIGDAPLAVAASGGADSFALLHACTARGLPVVALTVDHGLREGSAEDARVVARWCEERGVPHETLRWPGEKPEKGVQAAARAARYRLLCEACERLGLDRLATGHTLDDQAETVFMRLRRGAGRGLAGMPPARKIASGPGEPVDLLRPMLGARRADARAYAGAHGLPVRDDPSNEDEGFERVRVRALLGALEEQGLLTAEALGRTANEVAFRLMAFEVTEQVATDQWEAFFLSNGAVSIDMWDRERFWAEVHDAEPGCIDGTIGWHWRQQLLRQVFRCFGSEPTVAETPVIRPDTNVTREATIAESEHSYLHVYREPGALLGRADGTPGLAPVPAPAGSRHLYDRRFIVTVPEDVPPGTELCPLGQLMPRDIATSTLARSQVSTLPCLAWGEGLTHLPSQAAEAVREALAGWKRAGAFLDGAGTFEARSLLAERFANAVIRY